MNEYNASNKFSENLAVIVTDTNSKIIYVNNLCKKLYKLEGVNNDKIIGKDIRDIIHINRDKYENTVLPMLCSGKSWCGKIETKTCNKESLQCQLEIFPLKVGESTVAYIGLYRENKYDKFRHILELLDLANNKLNNIFIVITDENFNVLYCNNKAKSELSCIEGNNIYDNFNLSKFNLKDTNTFSAESIVTIDDNKVYYMKIEALKNARVHGYILKFYDNNLKKNLDKLSKLDYITKQDY